VSLLVILHLFLSEICYEPCFAYKCPSRLYAVFILVYFAHVFHLTIRNIVFYSYCTLFIYTIVIVCALSASLFL